MSDLIGIGVSGLSAYQRALATTSNNIANLQTEGYVRQRAVLQLHYDQEQNKRTIAAALGVSESRVSQIHGEAIRALRKALGDEG